MWCAACQQDVPGVAASATDVTISCARCGRSLAPRVPPAKVTVPFENLPEFVELEDWEFAETIQQAERLVSRVTAELSGNSTARQQSSGRPRTRGSASAPPTRPLVPAASTVRSATGATNATSLPWVVMAIGLAIFVCGAILTASSVVRQHPLMWQIGLPMVLGGQVAILAVVIWQLDAVWNSNRATFVALHAMDDEVRDLVRHWEQLEQSGELHNQQFYRHLSEGAEPEVLLADLKDQLDVLSEHLAQQRRVA